MILIACLDDAGGMMFNKRRQSQDRILRQHILQETEGTTLWMNGYSAKQFIEDDRFLVDDDFLDKAAPGDFCLIENIGAATHKAKIEKIVIYRWNRKYPADFYFDIPLAEHGWKLVETEEFAGYSHEKITKEVYEK